MCWHSCVPAGGGERRAPITARALPSRGRISMVINEAEARDRDFVEAQADELRLNLGVAISLQDRSMKMLGSTGVSTDRPGSMGSMSLQRSCLEPVATWSWDLGAGRSG